MKNSRKVLLGSVLLVVAGVISWLCYISFVLPDVGKPEYVKVGMDSSRIGRGQYLAHSVCVCMDCHSERDWNKYAGPLVEGTLGQGGEIFNQDLGFPGAYYAKNITPYGLQHWSDGEVLRAISSGVNKNGKALFPVMPYLNYGKLDREDLLSIIAYIRTLSPIHKDIPESKSDFPMNLLINAIPQRPDFKPIPDKNDRTNYGKYVFTAASCADCHTVQTKGKPVEEMFLAGGFKFPLKTGGTVNSANITPDMQTGIGSWDEDAFLSRFKLYAAKNYKPNRVGHGEFNTLMPWLMYATMETDDLKALFTYLRTVKPVKNEVTKFIP
ncbi:MAG TPA: c-type cytochrome [Paludibacter sp.]|nr:c-type cytochrome [Paludibacter sp.]